jgi:hypothetical protein
MYTSDCTTNDSSDSPNTYIHSYIYPNKHDDFTKHRMIVMDLIREERIHIKFDMHDSPTTTMNL